MWMNFQKRLPILSKLSNKATNQLGEKSSIAIVVSPIYLPPKKIDKGSDIRDWRILKLFALFCVN